MKLKLKQITLTGVGAIVTISIALGIFFYKKEKELKINKIDEYVGTYKGEIQNYIISDYEEEYNNLTDEVERAVNEKDLDKAESYKKSLEDLKEKIIDKNKDIFNEKNNEINSININDLGDDKKQQISNEKDEINNLNDENRYKEAMEDIDKLKEYILNSLDEKRKLQEEEKRKQEEEEKKKQEEQKNNNDKAKVDSNNNETKISPVQTPSDPVNSGDYVSKLKVAQSTNQILIVKGEGGSDALVEFHIKDGNGAWIKVFSTSAYVGQAGITYNKHESDRKTPAGVYSFGTGFGVASNPGASISYRTLTSNDYWVDDSNSKYYNRWVNGDVSDRDWHSAEHMIDYPAAYKYGIVINYNTYNTVPGKGSAIFLHCKTQPTPGCVGIPENNLVTLLRQINSSARIVISPTENDIYNF